MLRAPTTLPAGVKAEVGGKVLGAGGREVHTGVPEGPGSTCQHHPGAHCPGRLALLGPHSHAELLGG